MRGDFTFFPLPRRERVPEGLVRGRFAILPPIRLASLATFSLKGRRKEEVTS